uniref:Uncharacterized protein n=1 Tax=Alexandrium monilatum TaxID=311494 RepID=A0A7S4S1R6_9DINO|mmetsp:Transcript_88011/g.262453  ORF Transcript_88011/g.262453 Transcript_88011/m.262453 type:complete len:224 (+) Transcript_88011:54-725(+)
MQLRQLVAAFACVWAAQGQLDASLPDALISDDACAAGSADSEACNLGMLQKVRPSELPGAGDDSAPQANSILEHKLALPVIWAGRRDVRGIEACWGRNIGYCNSLAYRAVGTCGSPGCVIIVNPPGHRTRTPLHIHAYGYNGRGAALKRRMEARVCRTGGWVHGGFPCGGRAKLFRGGFPPLFSAAGGGISHACITAWPGSCGGGTIVLVSYHCSIEHSISQR